MGLFPLLKQTKYPYEIRYEKFKEFGKKCCLDNKWH